MNLTVIKIRSRWMYESELPAGTPHQVSHEIHVPDQIVPVTVPPSQHSRGSLRYRLQPHPMNLLDATLTAESLVNLAHARFCSEIYIVTTII